MERTGGGGKGRIFKEDELKKVEIVRGAFQRADGEKQSGRERAVRRDKDGKKSRGKFNVKQTGITALWLRMRKDEEQREEQGGGNRGKRRGGKVREERNRREETEEIK